MDEEIVDTRLEAAKALVAALEQENDEEADRILDEISQVRESMLFHKIGVMTRQLHEALRNFSVDQKIADFTTKDIPDAKERLSYVISATQHAADTTLGAIEEVLPLAQSLTGQATQFSQQWDRFRQREMPYTEFKSLSHELSRYFEKTVADMQTMNQKLNDILMAQEFQDITGQIIKRVLNLVQEVEKSLVELIRLSGERFTVCESVENELELAGPMIPGIDNGDSVGSQDEVDDLLSSLGF